MWGEGGDGGAGGGDLNSKGITLEAIRRSTSFRSAAGPSLFWKVLPVTSDHVARQTLVRYKIAQVVPC